MAFPRPLRSHQRQFANLIEAIAQGEASEVQDVLAAVTPGGGKSLLPVIAAARLIAAGIVRRIVWVVPRDSLRLQAEEAFADVGWPGGASVVVQVQQRRGTALYVNDGVYGSLADAGALGFRYPARLIRPVGAPPVDALESFSLFGPTCDSADRMQGPFWLPANAAEGDWIEIGQLGAYGACLRTAFNGFDRARLVEVRDAPLLSVPPLPASARRHAA